MYTVECDGITIFDDTSVISANDSKVSLISPKLSIADNAAGTFDCTLPINNQGYDSIREFVSTITIKRDNKWLWAGRPLTVSSNFSHQKTIKSEGVLSFLNDSILLPKTYKVASPHALLDELLKFHNTRVPESRKIYIGAVTVTASDGEFSGEFETNYETTYDYIKKHLVDILGGHLFITYSENKYKLNYYSDWRKSATQSIDFGVNLIDFTRSYDFTNICTVVIPRGKQLDTEGSNKNKYLTIESVNNGSVYIENSETIQRYGRVEKTVDFSDVEDAQVLLESGTAYLNAYQFDDMVLDVRAVDLHMLNRNIESFDLLDNVLCISRPHGMERWFPVTKMDIPLDKPESIEYNLGTTVNPTMSSISAKTNANLDDSLNELPNRESLIAEAFRNSNEILTAKTTGYVNVIQQDDHSQALIISDRLPYTTANHYWQFNMNGLGYFVRQNDGTYRNQGIALTMNGEINADMITTGHMNAEHIVAGSITVTQLADNSVTASKIKNGEISTSELANGAITETKIASGAITTGKIAANAITAGKIASGSITTDKISAGGIDANVITTGTLKADRIEAGSITTSKLDTGAVTTNKIANNAVTNSKIDSMSANKLTAGTIDANQITVKNLNANNITSGTISCNMISGGNLEMNVTNFTMRGRNTRNDSQTFLTSIDIWFSRFYFNLWSNGDTIGLDSDVTINWSWGTDTITFCNGVAVSNYTGYYSDYNNY